MEDVVFRFHMLVIEVWAVVLLCFCREPFVIMNDTQAWVDVQCRRLEVPKGDNPWSLHM